MWYACAWWAIIYLGAEPLLALRCFLVNIATEEAQIHKLE